MKIKSLLILCFCTLLMASCTSYKSVPYLQNPEAVNNFQEILPMYDAKIMPKDLLTITVNTSDPDASAPYNLIVQTSMNAGRSTSLTTQPTLQQYLVSNEGTIDFPVLGRLNVLGLTKGQAEDMIREKLAPHFTETPIVTVRMSNYKISVLGEVAKPGTFTVSNEKVNIFEALAMAGDLTVWGKRDNIKLIREDAQGKRQTSFVSLDVMPEIEDDLDVEIDEKDLRIDTYRSSGAGGQHINKTSSAIRITHIPTGTVVQCQNERSQFQNKDKAMQMLKAKLFLLKQEANVEKLSDIRGEVKEIGWGNQIRSYVLQPYTMVKDHRTDVESGNVDAVLDGSLDTFINGYLKWINISK